ncbi:MAG: hypothetical protein Q4F72_03010 [Desulfovibrionaceae bacterium]|nr:hypothetical protein [Desulfovibrionaceae bacterium]
MKKELITADNLDAYICKADGRLYVCQGRLLTPGAKDELSKRHVCVVYGPEPQPAPAAPEPAAGSCRSGCCCGTGRTFYVGPEEGTSLSMADSLESLSIAVAAMLKSRYGVTDPEELRAKTVEALRTIRDNI